MVKACNVANAAAAKVAMFLALYARNTYILCNTETERERRQSHAIDLKPYRTDHHTGVEEECQGRGRYSDDSSM